MAHSSQGRPRQHQLDPENAVEEQFLKNNKFYNHHEDAHIVELRMRSAITDLEALGIHELAWPSKEVQTKSIVQYVDPKSDTIIEDETIRTHREPMNYLEAADHFEKQAQDLRAQAKAMREEVHGLAVPPQASNPQPPVNPQPVIDPQLTIKQNLDRNPFGPPQQ